jgi:hypothetical protein
MKLIVSPSDPTDINADSSLTDVSYDETREHGFYAHIDPSRINVPRSAALPSVLQTFNVLTL